MGYMPLRHLNNEHGGEWFSEGNWWAMNTSILSYKCSKVELWPGLLWNERRPLTPGHL
jgi:hypothetical protein